MLARAERLDGQYLRNVSGLTALAGGRLWLRQADRELDPRGIAVISGRPSVAREIGAGWLLQEVTVWRLDSGGRPIGRIEAPRASLEAGQWRLEGAVSFGADRVASPRRTLLLPTELSATRIEDSFAPPDTLSFWALPEFIGLLENAGFSAVRHRLHFHSLMSLPLLACAMALLAAGFSMRPSRRGGVGRMLGLGVASGFALFMLDRITAEFGEAGSLPVVLAAWAPAAAGLMLALALLLHLEDG
jgi:lipopolysaccharide export system permease protein